MEMEKGDLLKLFQEWMEGYKGDKFNYDIL
jgi:hypothetical protein